MTDIVTKVDATTFSVAKDPIITSVQPPNEILTIAQATNIVNLTTNQVTALDAQYTANRKVLTDKVAKYQSYIQEAEAAGVLEAAPVPNPVTPVTP